MIYVDSSIVLATVGSEPKRVNDSFWEMELCSSRLLVYECWSPVNARAAIPHLKDALEHVVDRISFIDLAEPVLRRALAAFPTAVCTLDALHLSTALYLSQFGRTVEMATYDDKLKVASEALGLPLSPFAK